MTRFDIRSLTSLADALTLSVMIGLTAASAAAVAQTLPDTDPVVHRLPTVVVVGKAQHVEHLPTVVVVGKRASV